MSQVYSHLYDDDGGDGGGDDDDDECNDTHPVSSSIQFLLRPVRCFWGSWREAFRGEIVVSVSGKMHSLELKESK